MDPKRLPGSLKAAILVHAGGKRIEEKLFPLLEEEEKSSCRNSYPKWKKYLPI